MKKIIWVGVVSVALTPLAVKADSGVYFGAGAGHSRVHVDKNYLPITGVTASSLSKYENNAGYKLFVGVKINRYFSIESGWIDLGEARLTRTVTSFVDSAATVKLNASGVNSDLISTLPINVNFSILLRAGTLTSRKNYTPLITGPLYISGGPVIVEETSQLHYGLGLQGEMNRQWGIRGEWERASVSNEPDVDLFSISTIFKL